jgi:hypothetical protein
MIWFRNKQADDLDSVPEVEYICCHDYVTLSPLPSPTPPDPLPLAGPPFLTPRAPVSPPPPSPAPPTAAPFKPQVVRFIKSLQVWFGI